MQLQIPDQGGTVAIRLHSPLSPLDDFNTEQTGAPGWSHSCMSSSAGKPGCDRNKVYIMTRFSRRVHLSPSTPIHTNATSPTP